MSISPCGLHRILIVTILEATMTPNKSLRNVGFNFFSSFSALTLWLWGLKREHRDFGQQIHVKQNWEWMQTASHDRIVSKLHRVHSVLCIVSVSLYNHAQSCVSIFKRIPQGKSLNIMDDSKFIITSWDLGPLRIKLRNENRQT